MMIKDAELRDNPPATDDDPFIEQMFGQRSVYNGNRPEVHDVLRRWRALADTYDPPRVLLGETNVEHLETLATYYGDGRRRAAPGLQLPLHRGALRGRGPARRRGAHRGTAPRRGLAGVDGLEPRRVAPRHPLGRRRPGQGPRRPARSCSPCGAPRCSTRATRSAWPTARSPRPTCSTRWPALLARLPGPRPRAHADALDATGPGGGFTAAGVRPGCPWPTPPEQRGRPARRPRLGAAPGPRPGRPAPAHAGPRAGTYRDPGRALRRLVLAPGAGPGPPAGGRWSPPTSRRCRSPSRCPPAGWPSAPTDRRRGHRPTAARARRLEGLVLEVDGRWHPAPRARQKPTTGPDLGGPGPGGRGDPAGPGRAQWRDRAAGGRSSSPRSATASAGGGGATATPAAAAPRPRSAAWLVISYSSRIDRAIVEVVHPAPRSISWLVTVVYDVGLLRRHRRPGRGRPARPAVADRPRHRPQPRSARPRRPVALALGQRRGGRPAGIAIEGVTLRFPVIQIALFMAVATAVAPLPGPGASSASSSCPRRSGGPGHRWSGGHGLPLNVLGQPGHRLGGHRGRPPGLRARRSASRRPTTWPSLLGELGVPGRRGRPVGPPGLGGGQLPGRGRPRTPAGRAARLGLRARRRRRPAPGQGRALPLLPRLGPDPHLHPPPAGRARGLPDPAGRPGRRPRRRGASRPARAGRATTPCWCAGSRRARDSADAGPGR